MTEITIYDAAEILCVSTHMLARLRRHIPGFPEPRITTRVYLYDEEKVREFGKAHNVYKLLKDIERVKKRPNAAFRRETTSERPPEPPPPKLAINVARLF